MFSTLELENENGKVVDESHSNYVQLTIGVSECFSNAVAVAKPSIIPNNQMTASSYYDSNFLPAYGRLHFAGGWCARSPSRNNEWLMVDLGQLYRVCGVATQGYDGGNVWVTAFKLFYSRDGKSWTSYEEVIGTEMVRFNIIWTKEPNMFWCRSFKNSNAQ